MKLNAGELSPNQKTVLEDLLGRPLAEDEAVSIRVSESPDAPEWLRQSWESAERLGLSQLSMDEMDAEIAAARKDRRAIDQSRAR
jgi:hypothetical protein